ncbi:unnamed protein product [Brassica oleracea]
MDENNSAPGIDATDQEKIEFLTKKVVSVEEKVKYLKGLLNIRGETVKIHMLLNSNRKLRSQKKLKPPQKPRLLLNSKLLSYFFCLVILGKEEWCKTSSGVDHQDEDDIEVEHGAKESDTSKVNEEQPQEEEEQKKKMIQKSMWTTVIRRVKIQKPMK